MYSMDLYMDLAWDLALRWLLHATKRARFGQTNSHCVYSKRGMHNVRRGRCTLQYQFYEPGAGGTKYA